MRNLALAIAVTVGALGLAAGSPLDWLDVVAALLPQAAAVGTVALGLLIVLRLGEVDLSVGSVSVGAAAAVAVLPHRYGVPEGAAAAIAIGAATAVGVGYAMARTRLVIPSFAVTLAGLFVWDAAAAYLLDGRPVGLARDGLVFQLGQTSLPAWIAWSLYTGAMTAWATAAAVERTRLAAAGGPGLPRWRHLTPDVVAYTVVAAAVAAAIVVSNERRGTPLVLAVFLLLALAVGVSLRYPSIGRRMATTADTPERNSHPGVGSGRVPVVAFAVGGALVGVGGVMQAGVTGFASTGSFEALFTVLAVTLIGGVSLYGRRGGAGAILLGLVAFYIAGLGLAQLGLPQLARHLTIAGILAVAMLADGVAHRRRGRSHEPSQVPSLEAAG